MCGPVGHPAWIIIVFLWPSNNQDCRVFVSLSLSLCVLSVFLSDLGAGFTRLLVGVYLPATSAAAAAGLAGDHVPVGH